jgi:ABC-2 type transport system ATP-binding protein
MLNIEHLRKSFGPLVAVDDVSFRVERGTLVGLLGPNGAGKTTTVSMIAGLVKPKKARGWLEARLSGDTDPKKRRIGLVPRISPMTSSRRKPASSAAYSQSGGR